MTRDALTSAVGSITEDVQELVEDKATREDVSQRASEVVQTLNHSVATGNQQVVDILANTKSLVNATHTAIQQKQCVIREEVRAEVVSVVRAEVESLRDMQREVNSTVQSVREDVQEDVESLRAQVSVVQTEVESLRRYIAEVQQRNTALLLLAINPNSRQNPAPSCKNIPLGSPSGNYWIQGTSGPTQQYCDMTRTCCNSTGGWMRVANLDMTDPNQQCPSGFTLVTSPKRVCGYGGWASTTYPVHGVEYSRVCGRIIGYQWGTPEAFAHYIHSGHTTTIDGTYVDRVSLTHGSSPRKHIWTFVAANGERATNNVNCPCTRSDGTYTETVPPFIGQDYFCETGSRDIAHPTYYITIYSADPLWNGQGCGPQSTCCSFNNPPWFCKHLPEPTRDDIELRLIRDYVFTNEDTPLEVVEIYVQ